MPSNLWSDEFRLVYNRFQKIIENIRLTFSKDDLDKISFITNLFSSLSENIIENFTDDYFNKSYLALNEFNVSVDNSISKYNTLSNQTIAFIQDKLDQLYRKVIVIAPTIISHSNRIAQDLINKIELERKVYSAENEKQRNISEEERKKLRAELSEYRRDREKLLNDLNVSFKKSQEDASTIENLKTKLVAEWDEFRDKYKDVFAKAEVLRQSNEFKSDSENYLKLSKSWRYIILGVLSIVLIISFWFLYCCYDDLKCILKYQPDLKEKYFDWVFYLKIGSKILLRIFILSILIYVLRFVIKQYNALMHNFTISAHKHSSLLGSLRIVEAINSEKVQEEFIASAGKEIFTQHKTGYLTKEDSAINLSLLKKITGLFNNK